jgi:hypothetical protein
MSALPIQMARDVAAMSQSASADPAFLNLMREGAYDHNDASVKAALLGIQTGRLLPNDGDLSPEYIAGLFYEQDDKWQAAFFNVMQAKVRAIHEDRGGAGSYGVPAGEPQWCAATQHLTDDGFATLQAMYEHACYHRGIGLDGLEKAA